MGLKVWIQGTKDINDYGLSNTSITNSNVTLDSSGKLGSCLSFNGSSSHLLGSPAPLTNNSNEWTFACWMKVNAVHNGCLLSERVGVNSTGITIFYYSSQWMIDDGTRWQFTPTTTIAVDTWYHVCIVRKKGVGKYLYINGVLDKSTTATGTPSTVSENYYSIGRSQNAENSPSDNKFNGYLNDIRIYDHALSAQEIKDISSGLMCHYPLSREGFGQDSLLADADDLTTWNKESGVSCTYDSEKQMYCVSVPSRTSSCYGIYKQISCNPNTTYVLSITGEQDGTTQTAFGLGAGGAWPSTNTQFTTKRRKYVAYTTGENTTTLRAYLCVFPRSDNTKCGYFVFPKIEVGSIATPWIPSPSNPLYAKMGLDTGIVYDVSGFQNNSTSTTGTLTYSSDTPKYTTSALFNGNTYITTSANSQSIGTGDFTISAWIKLTSSSKTYLPIISNKTTGASSVGCAIYFNHNQNKFLWSTADGSGNTEIWTSNTFADIYDTWTHVVMVRNSSDARKGYFYINGVRQEIASVPAIRNISTDHNFVIGGLYTDAANYRWTGNISDVRVYTTALSESQILELYNASTIASS